MSGRVANARDGTLGTITVPSGSFAAMLYPAPVPDKDCLKSERDALPRTPRQTRSAIATKRARVRDIGDTRKDIDEALSSSDPVPIDQSLQERLCCECGARWPSVSSHSPQPASPYRWYF
jgi:hypothetical protein